MRNRRPLALTSLVAALALTQLGIDIGGLLGGVIVTEQVFGLPGFGQLAWQPVTNQDEDRDPCQLQRAGALTSRSRPGRPRSWARTGRARSGGCC
jgi:hypothetical protein